MSENTSREKQVWWWGTKEILFSQQSYVGERRFARDPTGNLLPNSVVLKTPHTKKEQFSFCLTSKYKGFIKQRIN